MFMERSLQNSDATSVRRKTRSLDPRGLCESGAINGALNYATKRKHLENVPVESARPLKKRNSRKDVSLIRRRKKTRNSNVLCSGDGVVSASNSFDQTYLANPISRSLSENAVSVPRRQRGFSGRKKFEACSLMNLSETTFPITDNDISTKKRSNLFSNISVFPNGTKKKLCSGMKRCEEDISSLHDGDLSPTRILRRNEKKMKNFCAIKSNEALSCSVDTFQDEDEENLEHNAARMLCSRFNPTRTRSNANRKLSMMPPNFFTSPFQKFVDSDVSSPVGSKLVSLDGVGMVLRPRKQPTTRDMFRKRRHFYELLFKDLDANWVLHRRIKIFWPLDQNWYFGLVNGYDPQHKLHLVKYDGRDEEWVNLENERFKLLLFASEVPENIGKNNLLVNGRSKSDENKSTEDESYTNSFLDSEPIITWLARSTRQLKSTHSGLFKKQKISHLPASSELSAERCEMFESMDTCCSKKHCNILLDSSVIRERSADVSEKSEHRSVIFPKNEKVSLVYYRRRKYKHKHIYHKHIYNNIWVRIPRLFSPFISGFCNMKDSSGCCRRVDLCQLSSIVNDGCWQNLSAPLIKLHQSNFNGVHREIMSGHPYGGKEALFTCDILMLKCGLILAKFPLLELEIFFMDDTSGPKLFQFEGCINQVASVLFLMSNSFNESNTKSMVNSQHSIAPFGLKFSCIHDTKKRILFSFCNFSKLKEFEWSHLDSKFTQYCAFPKKLPFSQCIFGIIRALQSDYDGLLISPVTKEASIIMVMQSMYHQNEIFTKLNTNRLFVDEKRGLVSSFSLSFTTPPALFPGTYLKSIFESNISHTSLQYRAPLSTREDNGMFSCLNMACCSESGCFSSEGIIMNSENYLHLASNVPASSGIIFSPQTEDRSGICCLNDPLMVEISLIPSDFMHPESNYIIQVQKQQSYEHYYPENYVDMGVHTVKQSFGLFWNSNVLFDTSNSIGPRGICGDCRCSTPPYPGSISYIWASGKADNFCGFGNRQKKPRTQVSYMTPFKAQDGSSPKSFQYGGFCHKKIRTSENRTTYLSEKSEKKSGLFTCEANILITAIDKGWRECGAHVVLEFVDHSEWKLAVKLMGAMRYSYKAHQFLQAATTNRYTHDFMWKGGKDWILEFPKKDQWARFKEIYAECYNRNFHGAAVKNIPIPGVFLKEERDDNVPEVSYVRDSSIYFRQLENDVEMALNPSRILYDMDSDDEQWVLINCISSDRNKSVLGEINNDIFEKAIDMFEKASFAENNEHFNDDELGKLATGIGSLEAVKGIYEYWHHKRKRKGLSLIRHFQPPLWKRYQEQVKEWELTTGKPNSLSASSSDSFPEKLAADKPPMFAFCLKPRGLEVPRNKCSRQRSYKKFHISGKHINNSNSGAFGDQEDGFRPASVRSLNSLSFGCSSRSPDFAHPARTIPGVFPSSYDTRFTRCFSSTGTDYSTGRIFYPRFQRSRSNKFTEVGSRSVGSMRGSAVHRSPGECSGAENGVDKTEFDEFRLRQALSAAKHSSIMAKLKREKAQRLLYRADLAIHKAVVALMMAEEMKGSS